MNDTIRCVVLEVLSSVLCLLLAVSCVLHVIQYQQTQYERVRADGYWRAYMKSPTREDLDRAHADKAFAFRAFAWCQQQKREP